MHEQYLRRMTRRTGFILGLTQLILCVLVQSLHIAWNDAIIWLVIVQMVTAAIIFIMTMRNLYKTRHQPVLDAFSDKELPTVTIAIPARNETPDLEDCLRSVIANNYPKFEVLVLDDCSRDKTPDIIKSFAQDGVRFIKGAEPNDNWLAKNQAYDKLADEANGEIILFCGVDVRFGPETIRALVTTMLVRRKDMISVLPRRLQSRPLESIIQPMRYWWELALPRRLFNRPPVLSTCWMIRRKALKQHGGFEAVHRAILPEGYFAREVIKSDGYSFMRADDVLDVQTRKSVQAQRETAIRTRYPQLKRRPEWVMGLVIAELVLFVLPALILISALWQGFGLVQMLAGVAYLCVILTHVVIVQVSDPANVLVAIFNFPIVAAIELYLGLRSMIQYEFSTVIWKDRNICVPVMHVVPHLPPIEDRA